MPEKASGRRQKVSTKNAHEPSNRPEQPVESLEKKQWNKKEKQKSSELNNSSSSSSGSTATLTEASFKETVKGLFCDDTDQEIRTLQYIKTILSKDENPPIDALIKDKVAPRCVQFLRHEQNTSLQLEAVTVLATITTGTRIQEKWVGRKENLEPLVDLLKSSDIRIVEQALWALGSISERIPILRNFLVYKGIVPTLVELLTPENSPSIVIHVAMILSVIRLSTIPLPHLQKAIELCLSDVAKVLPTISDEGALVSALHNLTIGPEENTLQVVASGVVPKLVQLLDSKCHAVVLTCIRIVANIAAYADLIPCIVDADVFSRLTKLLKSADPLIVHFASFAVTNIAGKTIKEDEECVIPGLVPLLIAVLHRENYPARKQAVRALALVADKQNPDDMTHLCKKRAIAAICEMMKYEDLVAVTAAVRAISELFKYASEAGQYKRVFQAVDKCDVWTRILKFEQFRALDEEKMYELVRQHSSTEYADFLSKQR